MPPAHALYELDIRLAHVEPPIWRTLEMPGSATLADLHFAIQLAMGWENSHLHQFVIGKVEYGMPHDGGGERLEDERAHALEDVAKAGSRFRYIYDFGDDWAHDVRVTRVTPSTKVVRPRCIAGARACPPEDCGGVPGYERLLAALRDPKHPDRAELMAWAPDGFSPEQFTADKRDLTHAIGELADHDDGDQGLGPRGNELTPDDAAMLGLPKDLVAAALALEPMERASLVALLAGSLAHDLLGVIDAVRGAARRTAGKPRVHSTARRRRAR